MKLSNSNYKLYFQINPLVDVSKLNYEEVMLLIAYLTLISNGSSNLYKDHYEIQNKKYQDDRKEREEKKKEFYENLLPKILKWAALCLGEGTRLKFKGTRDRAGIREVLSYNPAKNPRHIMCLQIKKNRAGEEVYGAATNHGIDKVTHVMIDKEWIKIAEVCKNF